MVNNDHLEWCSNVLPCVCGELQ